MAEEKPRKNPANTPQLNPREARELLEDFFEPRRGTVSEAEREAAVHARLQLNIIGGPLREPITVENLRHQERGRELALLHTKACGDLATTEEARRISEILREMLEEAEKEVDARIAAHGNPWLDVRDTPEEIERADRDDDDE